MLLFCLARRAILAGRERTIGCLLKLSCGLCALARRGAIYPRASASGPRCGNASGDGRSKAYLSGFLRPCRKISISNMRSSTARSLRFTGTAPAQKGDSKSGYRQVARRADNQDRRSRRRAGQPGALCPAARPASRQRRCRTADHGHRFRGSHRRQSFRQQRLARNTQRAGRCCCDPSQGGSHNAYSPRRRNV